MVKSMEKFLSQQQFYVQLDLNTFRFFPDSWFITGYVTSVTQMVVISSAGTAYPSGDLSSPRF